MSRHAKRVWTRLQRLWALLVSPAGLEGDPQFRASLTEVMYSGLRWGGGALCVGVFVHLGIEIGVRGKSVVWLYAGPTDRDIAVLYHVVTLGIGAGLMGLPVVRIPLRVGRLAVAATIVMTCSFSIHDDLLRGAPVSIAFVVMVYMSILVVVPFRPWQATAIGGSIVGVFGLLTSQNVLPPGAIEQAQEGRQAAELVLAVVLGTAMSAVLYASRCAHHRVRTEAQQELEAARDEAEAERERAESALATVQAQAQTLRERDETKSRFFANISHELRTPLSLMLDPVRRMVEQEERPAAEAERLRLVYRNARRLHRLVRQLLDLARHDANRLTLEPRRRDWPDFVRQVTRRLMPMAEAAEVALSVDAVAGGGAAVFDADRMETVVANLVRNALTYTPSGGTVRVAAALEGRDAVLRVTDDGPGIPEAEQEDLFDRFYRGAGTSEHTGTGIGLSLTKALVTAHEGALSVESTVGEGSTFTVRWPGGLRRDEVPSGDDEAAEGAPRDSETAPLPPERRGPVTREPEQASPGEGAAALDRTTVLLVEDNVDVRLYLRGLLAPRYRVREARNGKEGVRQARALLPDLVVADVMMPGGNGREMLRALRRSKRTDCIPVILLTARAEAPDRVAGLEEGADAYVTKPFDAEVLTAQIDRLIATRRQLRERLQAGPPTRPSVSEAHAPSSFDERLRAVIREQLADPDLTVAQVAAEIGLARRTVTRKTKAAFGQPPSSLIRAMRLERGAELLVEESGTVSEIAYAVGFNSLSYFSRCFKDHFGRSPTAYRQEAA